LEILTDGGSQSVLLPFTRLNVPTVDIASGKIIIDPPEGLFEDSAK
jgi:16S rRNA processing protein RimM